MRRTNFLLIVLGLVLLLTYVPLMLRSICAGTRSSLRSLSRSVYTVFNRCGSGAATNRSAQPRDTGAHLCICDSVSTRPAGVPAHPLRRHVPLCLGWPCAGPPRPYRYAPDARELIDLRNETRSVWRSINRPTAVTVYPPGAGSRTPDSGAVGNSVTGFKIMLVIAELIGALC
jgi:hypothetical protein